MAEQSETPTEKYGDFAINLLVCVAILTATLSGVEYVVDRFGMLAALPVFAAGYLATIIAEYYLLGEIHV